MKKFIKKLVLGFLVALARKRLKRLKPLVIGITGSVGKTGAKDAIIAILKSRYAVIGTPKSYNTEFGLPLTILEQASGFSSVWGWIKALVGATLKAFFGNKNIEKIVLEMGVDKPGDMAQLLSVTQPNIGVMTAIKPVHLNEGQFQTVEEIFKEKSQLIEHLPPGGIAVLNIDDPLLDPLAKRLKKPAKEKGMQLISFGTSQEADLRATNIQSNLQGIDFTITYKKESLPLHLPLIGETQIYVVLPAIAVAITQGIPLKEAYEILKKHVPAPGRMTLLEGIEGSLILDSSYNASPETVKTAIDTLAKENSHRRIAVLGTMNELGSYSEQKHREVGEYAAHKIDLLFTIGEKADLIGEGALKKGMAQANIHHFSAVAEALIFLKSIIKKDDIILVKGSQNRVRLERLVEGLMKDPSQAKNLLARQDTIWKKLK